MKINKQELVKALETVKPGLASKEIIEQSTSFAFVNGNLITYNDEICVQAPVHGIDFEGAVKAEELYKFINKIKTEEIEMQKEENEIVLVSGRSKAGFILHSEITLPFQEIEKPKKWKDLPVNFIPALKMVFPNCSNDMSMPQLTCVHLTKEGNMEASDRQKIIQYKTGQNLPIQKNTLLPQKSAKEVIHFSPVKMAESDGWVHFLSENDAVMSCRVLEGEFPKVESFFTPEGILVELPSTLSEVLEKASIFSKRDFVFDEIISLNLANKRLKIRAESDSGWFEEELNIKYTDSPFTFSVIPSVLMDIIKETNVCRIDDNRILFTGDDWNFVCSLITESK